MTRFLCCPQARDVLVAQHVLEYASFMLVKANKDIFKPVDIREMEFLEKSSLSTINKSTLKKSTINILQKSTLNKSQLTRQDQGPIGQ